MAYRYTGGMSLEDLLNIDPEQLLNMPKPALREAVSRMADASNKRVRRALYNQDYPSPAIKQARRGGKFTTKDKDITGLRNEYLRARNFLLNPLSSASGYSDVKHKIRDDLKTLGYKVKLKDIPKMIDAYSQLTQEDGSVLTRGERYKYLREIGYSVGITDKDEAEKTGEALLDKLADSLAYFGIEGDEFYESDDGSVAGFFRELE